MLRQMTLEKMRARGQPDESESDYLFRTLPLRYAAQDVSGEKAEIYSRIANVCRNYEESIKKYGSGQMKNEYQSFKRYWGLPTVDNQDFKDFVSGKSLLPPI